MKSQQFQGEESLKKAFAQPGFLLFKHSFRCGISGAAEQEYDRFVAAHPGFPTGWIDVVDQRQLSAWVAEEVGVRHQSPQALLFMDGKVVWSETHHSITEESLAEATEALAS